MGSHLFFTFKKLSQTHPQQEEDIHKNYPHQKQEKNDAFLRKARKTREKFFSLTSYQHIHR